jgi:hypothetical protein
MLMAEGLSIDEQNFLGNFLVTVGQDILTIAAQVQAIENKKSKNSVQSNTDNNT